MKPKKQKKMTKGWAIVCGNKIMETNASGFEIHPYNKRRLAEIDVDFWEAELNKKCKVIPVEIRIISPKK